MRIPEISLAKKPLLHWRKSIIHSFNTNHMEKQPFDEAGLQSLLQALYALPDQELSEQANGLNYHPKMWINGHFELDIDQLQYLDQMPQSVADFMGLQGSFALLHRLPITLDKKYQTVKDASNGDDDQGKLFKPTSNLAIETDSEGNVTASGDLILSVTYVEAP